MAGEGTNGVVEAIRNQDRRITAIECRVNGAGCTALKGVKEWVVELSEDQKWSRRFALTNLFIAIFTLCTILSTAAFLYIKLQQR